MLVLLMLFRISLWQWYGLKVFIENLKQYKNLEKVGFIVELYKEIPPLFSLFLKLVEACFFFDLLLTLWGKTSKKLHVQIYYTAWKVSKYGVFSGPYFPAFGLNKKRYEVSLRTQSECGKRRTRKNSVLLHFSHSVSLQILGLKLIKLDSIIIVLHFDTIKIVKNKLDGACGLPLVGSVFCLICFPSLLAVFFFLSLFPLYKFVIAFVAGFWCSCLVKLCIFDVLSSKVIVFVGFFSDFIPS